MLTTVNTEIQPSGHCCYTFCHRWSLVEFIGVADGCGQSKCSLQDSFHCNADVCVSMRVCVHESISKSECTSGYTLGHSMLSINYSYSVQFVNYFIG